MTSSPEIWKDIPGYEGRYQASDQGRIRSVTTPTHEGRVIKTRLCSGYPRVNLGHRNSVLVHRVVALTFIPNPDGKPQVNHINGVKTDNRVLNLEWCTASENQKHRFHVLHTRSGGHPKRPVICVDTGEKYESSYAAARAISDSQGNITSCCRGKRRSAKGYRWAYAEEAPE